jgi:hypothetical protein
MSGLSCAKLSSSRPSYFVRKSVWTEGKPIGRCQPLLFVIGHDNKPTSGYAGDSLRLAETELNFKLINCGDKMVAKVILNFHISLYWFH